MDNLLNTFQHMLGLDPTMEILRYGSWNTGKNRSKLYDGLLMVICWLAKSSGFKDPELLTNHHMVFMKSGGFYMIFHWKLSHFHYMVLIYFFSASGAVMECKAHEHPWEEDLEVWS